MSTDPTARDRLESAIRSCYSTWGESYYRDYYESASAYPPVHTHTVRRELKAARPGTLLDAGCGPASMLRDLGGLGIERFGFDLTPEMAEEARRVLAAQGLPPDRVWLGSVLDRTAFRTPPGGWGAVICFGVLPHVPEADDAAVLANLAAATAPGGLVLVEARNRLFGLFTLNRYSAALFRSDLIGEEALRAAADPADLPALDAALAELDARFRLDLPPLRQGKAGEPGYDEVLSRTHVPFELKAQAERAGLTDVELLFYHYHCLPPMAEPHLPALFRARSLAMEDPRDWRGYVMASAFILKARKPA